jgi:hypothetical protein
MSSLPSCSIAKHLESANTMFSFVWWIIGFYWVSAGGEVLTRDAPQLYWYTVFFLIILHTVLENIVTFYMVTICVHYNHATL